MENSFGNFEYKDKKGEAIDFEKKRFKFWLENVPKEIRRMEYDLSVGYRKLLHANLYKFDNKQQYGRFILFPEFSEEIEKDMWNKFIGSFLKGHERFENLEAIVANVRENLSEIISDAGISIPDEKIKLVAIGGSSFYGPRRAGERLSDIDIYFLLDEDDSTHNFEILPKINADGIGNKNPYHLIGTGYKDVSRGEKNQIHWLLYPHFPVVNKIENDDLLKIMSKISDNTNNRKNAIEAYINNMQIRLEQLRGMEIREDHKVYGENKL